MPRVWACFNVYKEAATALLSVRSVFDFADIVLVIDGAYETFPREPNEAWWSDDGTIEIMDEQCRKVGMPLLYVRGLWKDEVSKRNKYLEIVPDNDWVLWIDGHEQFALLPGVAEKIKGMIARDECDWFTVTLTDWQEHVGLIDITFEATPRLFRKVLGLHYKYNHYSLYDAEEKYFFHHYRKADLGEKQIRFLHMLRSRERTRKQRQYYQDMWEKVSGFEGEWICAKCNLHYKLSEGQVLKCPQCGASPYFPPDVP